MKRYRYTAEKKTEILGALRESDNNFAQTAAKFGISVPTLRSWASVSGVRVKRPLAVMSADQNASPSGEVSYQDRYFNLLQRLDAAGQIEIRVLTN